jgi:hypothetical protein
MFAYFKNDNDYLGAVFCVLINGSRWHECPNLRQYERIKSTKKLVSLRKAKAMPAYFVHNLTLCRY